MNTGKHAPDKSASDDAGDADLSLMLQHIGQKAPRQRARLAAGCIHRFELPPLISRIAHRSGVSR